MDHLEGVMEETVTGMVNGLHLIMELQDLGETVAVRMVVEYHLIHTEHQDKMEMEDDHHQLMEYLVKMVMEQMETEEVDHHLPTELLLKMVMAAPVHHRHTVHQAKMVKTETEEDLHQHMVPQVKTEMAVQDQLVADLLALTALLVMEMVVHNNRPAAMGHPPTVMDHLHLETGEDLALNTYHQIKDVTGAAMNGAMAEMAMAVVAAMKGMIIHREVTTAVVLDTMMVTMNRQSMNLAMRLRMLQVVYRLAIRRCVMVILPLGNTMFCCPMEGSKLLNTKPIKVDIGHKCDMKAMPLKADHLVVLMDVVVQEALMVMIIINLVAVMAMDILHLGKH